MIERRGRYRLLVEAITDYAIYMLDPDGPVTSWNAGASASRAMRPSEIIGQHFSRFYTEEDRASGAAGAGACEPRPERASSRVEGWRVRKDGARFWAHVVIDPIRYPPASWSGSPRSPRPDRAQSKPKKRLRRSEEQFRLLVQGVTDYAIYMLNPDGRVASWNAGAQRIKGLCARRDHRRAFLPLLHRRRIAAGEPARALATAAREGRFENEGWRVRKDGTRFWAHVVIDAIHDRWRRLLGFAKITRDITERREAQACARPGARGAVPDRRRWKPLAS